MDATKTRKTNYLFLSGLLIINLVSLLLLSLFNYRFFYLEEEKAYEEKFRASAAKEIELYVDNIDVQLKTMLSIPSLYFSETSDNYALLYPQEHPIIGSPEEVRNLNTVLSKIQKTYPFLYSMDVYYEGSGTVITNFAHIHAVESTDQVCAYLPWFEKIPVSMNRSCFLPFDSNSYPSAYPTMSYVQKISNKRWGDKDIYVALHFDPSLVKLPDKGFYLSAWILDPDGKVVFGNSDFDWQRQLVEDMGTKGLDGNFTRQITNANGKFVSWSNTSSSTNLKYCSFIGYKMLYPGYSEDNTRLVRNFILLILCNVLCLGVLTLLNYLVYKNYIMSFSHSVGIRTKGSLGQTLKTMETTIENLDDVSKSYKNQSLLRSLLINRAEKDVYDSVYNAAHGDYVCCVIVEQSTKDVEIELEEVRTCVSELSQDDNAVLFTTFASPPRIAFAFILKEPTLGDANLQKIRQLGTDLRIDVGGVCPLRVNGFQNSFSSAMDVYEYRFLYDRELVLLHDSLHLEAKKPFGDHVNLLSQIEKFIKLEQKEPTLQLLEKLFNDLEKGEYSVQYCKATLGDLVTSIYSILIQNKIDMWTVLGYDIRAYSKRIGTIAECKVWMSGISETVINAIAESRTKSDNALSQKIDRIIEENLDHDVSLGMLADKLGIREDALSRSFKSLMGCNYMEFITERKLQRAIELLYQDIPVQEISAALGYRSPQYFIKVFKNAYGVTPHKFRKKRDSVEEQV